MHGEGDRVKGGVENARETEMVKERGYKASFTQSLNVTETNPNQYL